MISGTVGLLPRDCDNSTNNRNTEFYTNYIN